MKTKGSCDGTPFMQAAVRLQDRIACATRPGSAAPIPPYASALREGAPE